MPINKFLHSTDRKYKVNYLESIQSSYTEIEKKTPNQKENDENYDRKWNEARENVRSLIIHVLIFYVPSTSLIWKSSINDSI